MRKWLLLLLIFLLAIQPLIVSLLAWRLYQYQAEFMTASQVSRSSLASLVERAWQAWQTSEPRETTWLILGLDNLDGRETPPLTDTILLLHFDARERRLVSLPLPRDLWHPQYRVKINALYSLGLAKDPTQASEFVRTTLSEFTGVPIERVVTVSLADLIDLVEILGGLWLQVEHAFTDERFPRLIDPKTATREADLYEKASFSLGWQHLDAYRVNQFIRSRKAFSSEGNDLARAARQQQVVTALIETLSTPTLITQPRLLGSLLAYYQAHFASQLPIEALVSLLYYLPLNHRQLSLPIEENNPRALIYHPPARFFAGQWVYLITSPERFREQVRSLLHIQSEDR